MQTLTKFQRLKSKIALYLIKSLQKHVVKETLNISKQPVADLVNKLNNPSLFKDLDKANSVIEKGKKEKNQMYVKGLFPSEETYLTYKDAIFFLTDLGFAPMSSNFKTTEVKVIKKCKDKQYNAEVNLIATLSKEKGKVIVSLNDGYRGKLENTKKHFYSRYA